MPGGRSSQMSSDLHRLNRRDFPWSEAEGFQLAVELRFAQSSGVEKVNPDDLPLLLGEAVLNDHRERRLGTNLPDQRFVHHGFQLTQAVRNEVLTRLQPVVIMCLLT